FIKNTSSRPRSGTRRLNIEGCIADISRVIPVLGTTPTRGCNACSSPTTTKNRGNCSRICRSQATAKFEQRFEDNRLTALADVARKASRLVLPYQRITRERQGLDRSGQVLGHYYAPRRRLASCRTSSLSILYFSVLKGMPRYSEVPVTFQP